MINDDVYVLYIQTILSVFVDFFLCLVAESLDADNICEATFV